MSFMRLGTRVAVINDAGEILLSKRGDFGIWALPGGRVDSGELIHESAIREVREETGLEVEIERAVGLYYQQGRGRTNVLYRAKPVGGELFDKTDETLANDFFAPDVLPYDLFGKFYIDHAYTQDTYVYTLKTPRRELIKLDLQLRWRWIQNLFAGKPEPIFTRFDIHAVGIIRQGDKVYAPNNELPCVVSDGNLALDTALTKKVQSQLRTQPDWQWVGLFQDVHTDTIEFVFAAETSTQSRNFVNLEMLPEQHQRYAAMTNAPDDVWVLNQEEFHE